MEPETGNQSRIGVLTNAGTPVCYAPRASRRRAPGGSMTTQSTEPRIEERRETLLPIPPAQFPYLWFSGEQVPWEQALVHVTTVGWPAISAIFEGIRGYWNDEQ